MSIEVSPPCGPSSGVDRTTERRAVTPFRTGGISPVGHEHVVSVLERAARSGKPAHAYLFSGREGIGKKLVALQFACLLNCPDLDHDLDASCPTCRRIRSGNHPDVIVESPERGIIRIERIRNLRGFFRYAPIEGRFRVAIIDDAHAMNGPAQNALLKTLEEPPAGRLLILVTSSPFRLLPTVRSRCRRVRFNPIPVEALAEVLGREKGIEPDRARVLAAVSCGSMSRALELDASHFLDSKEAIISVLERPGAQGMSGLLQLSQNMAEGKRVLDAIDVAVTWLRDILVSKIMSDTSALFHVDSLDRISAAAQHQSTEKLLRVYDEMVKAAALLESEINVNANLVTDVMFLRITRILAGPSLGLVTAG
ncbi:MAG: DNA polymerase III subunit delta' [Thermodesulfobacteriota bacterium]